MKTDNESRSFQQCISDKFIPKNINRKSDKKKEVHNSEKKLKSPGFSY